MKELILLLVVLMLCGLLVQGTAQRHALQRRLERTQRRHTRSSP